MNLNDLQNIITTLNTAKNNTPNATTPSGAGYRTGYSLDPSPSSSQQTGRAPGTGTDVISKFTTPAYSSVNPSSATLPLSSDFPYQGVDTFIEQVNDSGDIVTAEDFNSLIAGCRAIENYLLHAVRYAPIDLVDRMVSGERYLNGLDTSLGTSTITRPMIVTLGTTVTVTGSATQYVDLPTLSLTAGMRSILGLDGTTSEIENSASISFECGAKLQQVSVNPSTLDPASLCARVEAVVSSGSTINLSLCTGPYTATGSTYNNIYPINSGTPMIAPGKWYVWITLYKSPYKWVNL